jgi:hypothetical protein
MDGAVKKKGAGRPNRGGGSASKAQKQQSNASKGGGGFSRKGESESFKDGSLGDTVLAAKDPALQHPR